MPEQTWTSPGAKIFDCVCPTCGKSEGPFYIGHALWFYCRERKVKWIAGFDFTDEPPDDECIRRWRELEFREFKYLGPHKKSGR